MRHELPHGGPVFRPAVQEQDRGFALWVTRGDYVNLAPRDYNLSMTDGRLADHLAFVSIRAASASWRRAHPADARQVPETAPPEEPESVPREVGSLALTSQVRAIPTPCSNWFHIQNYFMNESDSSAATELGGLIGEFMVELHRYDRGRTLPLLHRSGLTTPQVATLEILRQPKTLSTVAKELGLSLPAASQMVDKLVRKTLVARTEGLVDRRQRSIVANAQGRSLVRRIGAARAARFDASLGSLSPTLRTRLQVVLVDVVEALRQARSEEEKP